MIYDFGIANATSSDDRIVGALAPHSPIVPFSEYAICKASGAGAETSDRMYSLDGLWHAAELDASAERVDSAELRFLELNLPDATPASDFFLGESAEKAQSAKKCYLFRKEFEIYDPALLARISFERVGGTFEVYVNGAFVGASGIGAGEFDASEHIVRGTNVLAVRAHSGDLSAIIEGADDEPGMYGRVMLSVRHRAHLADYSFKSHRDEFRLGGALTLRSSGAADMSAKIAVALGDKVVEREERQFVDGVAEIELNGALGAHSSEIPRLLNAYVRIFCGPKETECCRLTLGFAPIGRTGRAIVADGTEIFAKTCVYRHESGCEYRKALTRIKEHNFNAVALTGNNVPAGIYGFCDRLGLYAIRDLSFASAPEPKRRRRRSKAQALPDLGAARRAIFAFELAKAKNRACFLGVSTGRVMPSEFGGEPDCLVAGRDFAFSNAPIDGVPCFATIDADDVKVETLEASFCDPAFAGLVVSEYSKLFGADGSPKASADIARHVFRPYRSEWIDSRTLLLRNMKFFDGSDGLEVTVSAVKGVKETRIQTFRPVIAAGQTREYGVYVGEYDMHVRIYVRYFENGREIATESTEMRREKVLPEFIRSLEAVNNEYVVRHAEIGFDCIEENALPKRSFFVPCSSEAACVSGAPEMQAYVSDRMYILSGEWDFKLCAKMPETFGGDDCEWEKVALPASFESSGAAKFEYVEGYNFKFNPRTFAIASENPVGIYRKFVNIGDSDFRYILSFERVSGSLELQINGRYVGFSLLGSAEFEVTDFLKIGQNEIVAIVQKHTPASFLRGYDEFPATGLVGDVRLQKYHAHGLFDYRLKLKKLGAAHYGMLTLFLHVKEPTQCKVEIKKDGKTLFETTTESVDGKAEIEFSDNFDSYDAETVRTYDLFVKIADANFIAECTRLAIGFNEVARMGDVVFYNDGPFKIRGVIYNPAYDRYGEILSLDDIRADLELIKEYGFNAVRPMRAVAPEFCVLAQSLGLFVVMDPGICTDASRKADRKGRDIVCSAPAFVDLYKAIVLASYEKCKNATNVPLFLLPNDCESLCAKEALAELAECDKLVMALGNDPERGICVDFPTVNDVIDLINENAEKTPVFFSRYAYSEGVGCATMNEYNDLIENSPCCLGGCVAYFADETIKDVGHKSCGLFTFDKVPYPGAENIKYLYRPVFTEVSSDASSIEVFNAQSFLTTEDCELILKVVADGALLSETRLDVTVPPRDRRRYDIVVGHIYGDMFLNVEHYSKKYGKVLYMEQHALNREMNVFESRAGTLPLSFVDAFDCLEIGFDSGSVRFSKAAGSIIEYVIAGKPILKPDSVRRGGNCFVTNIRRPFVRNIAGDAPKVAQKVISFEVTEDASSGVCESARIDIESAIMLDGRDRYLVQDAYTVHSSGAIDVESALRPLKKGLPVMDCFGKQLRLRNSFGNVLYYGNGADDNYIDMCEHTRTGLFRLSVDRTFDRYNALQECGNRTNVRYAVVRDNAGDGIVISAKSAPFQLRVAPYSDAEIAEGYLTGKKLSQSGVYVDVNAFVSGIGSSENGHPMPQYLVGSGEHVLQFTLFPTSARFASSKE